MRVAKTGKIAACGHLYGHRGETEVSLERDIYMYCLGRLYERN